MASNSSVGIQNENKEITGNFVKNLVPPVILSWIIEKTLQYKSKSETQNLYDYCIDNKKWSNGDMRQWFNKGQRQKLKDNNTSEKFDFSLDYILLTKFLKDSDELIKHVKELKDIRNNFSHDDEDELRKKYGDGKTIKEIKDKSIEIINLAVNLPYIDQTEVDLKKNEFNEAFQSLTNYFDVFREEIKSNYKKQFSKLNPFSWFTNNVKSVEISNLFVDLKIDKCEHLQQNTNVELKKFMDLLQSDPVILIKGPPGSGKSTILQQMIMEWTTEEKNFPGILNYDLILFVQCRNKKSAGLKEYFQQNSSNLFSKPSFNYEQFLNYLRSKEILILVDGVDELNEFSKNIVHEIFEKFSSNNILITTRPESERNISPPKHIVITTLELNGIPSGNWKIFIKLYYEIIVKENDPDAAKDKTPENLFETIMKCPKEVRDILKHPLNMAMTVYLYLSKNTPLNLQTSTDLLIDIIISNEQKLKDRLKSKDEKNILSDDDRLQSNINKIREKLENIAFNCLVNGDITLSGAARDELRKECDEYKLPSVDIFATYLTYKYPEISYEPPYSFSHKSFQELFAAKYLLSICTDESEETQDKIMGTDILSKKAGQMTNCMSILLRLISKCPKKEKKILEKWGKNIIASAHGYIDFHNACKLLKFNKHQILLKHFSNKFDNIDWAAFGYFEEVRLLLQNTNPRNVQIYVCSTEDRESKELLQLLQSEMTGFDVGFNDWGSVHSDVPNMTVDTHLSSLIKSRCKLTRFIGFLSATHIQEIPRSVWKLTLNVTSHEHCEELNKWHQSLSSEQQKKLDLELFISRTVSPNSLSIMKPKINHISFFASDKIQPTDDSIIGEIFTQIESLYPGRGLLVISTNLTLTGHNDLRVKLRSANIDNIHLNNNEKLFKL